MGRMSGSGWNRNPEIEDQRILIHNNVIFFEHSLGEKTKHRVLLGERPQGPVVLAGVRLPREKGNPKDVLANNPVQNADSSSDDEWKDLRDFDEIQDPSAIDRAFDQAVLELLQNHLEDMAQPEELQRVVRFNDSDPSDRHAQLLQK